MTEQTLPTRRGRLVVLIGIVLVALTLRSAVTAVSPLVEDVRADLAIDTLAIGILGLLPLLCFAGVGALSPAIGRRLGLERALVLSLAVTAGGTVGRALMSNAVVFLALSAVTLAGMAMGNVLLPPLVKRYFPDHMGTVTAMYVVLMSVSATLPPYVAVPTADAFGWRVSLGSWGLVALVAILPWLPRLRARGDDGLVDPGGRLAVFRSWRAWGLTLMFAMTSLNVYSLFAWLPSLLIDAGFTSAEAGSLLGVYTAVGIPASVVVPVLAARMRNPFPLIVAFGVCFAVGYYGLLTDVTGAPVLWLILAGIGPATFPMSITMINVRTTTPAGSASLSGMVQGLGYATAGVGPPLFGVLHEATGEWDASVLLLMATVVPVVVGGWFACRSGTVEQELADRALAKSRDDHGISPVMTGKIP